MLMYIVPKMHVLLLFSALVHDIYIYNMKNHDDSRPVPQTTVLPPVMLAFPNEVPGVERMYVLQVYHEPRMYPKYPKVTEVEISPT